jgi:hypothetical protein
LTLGAPAVADFFFLKVAGTMSLGRESSLTRYYTPLLVMV